MIQLALCLLLLVPALALPALAFMVSATAGVVVGVVSLVLLIPLLVATYAHVDLLRARSRFGLRDDEVDEFSRLVPMLAIQPEFARLPRRDMRDRAKQAAAEIVLRGRRTGERTG